MITTMQKMQDILDKGYVVKSNCMVEAHYSLKSIHQKIVLILTSLHNPRDIEFKEVSFKVKDLMNILGIGSENYTYMKLVTKQLQARTIDLIEDGGDTLTQTNWMEYSRYEGSKGLVKLKLHHLLKPYILQLTGHFTKYKLSSVIHLSSSYSIRVYELLMQYIKIGKRTFTLDELKLKTGVPEGSFKRYPDFRRYVLLKAQTELEQKSDLCFDFIPIKSGKQIIKIEFTIFKNISRIKEISKNTGLNIDQINLTSSSDKKPIDALTDDHGGDFADIILNNLASNTEEDLIETLSREFGLKRRDTKKLIADFTKEKVWEKYHYYHYKSSVQEIKNPVAWFINSVVKDYNISDMTAHQKANEPDPLGDHLKELKIKEQELKVNINNTKQDISSPVAQYSESIRAGFETDLSKYQEELQSISEEIKILKSAYATE